VSAPGCALEDGAAGRLRLDAGCGAEPPLQAVAST
jgi:hypothetical protein